MTDGCGKRKRLNTRLTDRLLAYVEWREACRLVNDAYRSWADATGLRATAEFERYTAALDREEFAAATYADLVRRVGRVIPSEPNLGFQTWGATWP